MNSELTFYFLIHIKNRFYEYTVILFTFFISIRFSTVRISISLCIHNIKKDDRSRPNIILNAIFQKSNTRLIQ